MTSISSERQSVRAPEIVASVKISNVYRALTGKEPRRAGPGTWRAQAVWRGGDGFNVSMNDARRVWHDFTTDEGGGVLELVVRVRGGSRADALRWLADYAGIPLGDQPLSSADRARWAAERRETERDLPAARAWRQTAIALAEEALVLLKASFLDAAGESDVADADLRSVTEQLAYVNRLGAMETTLVAEYRFWCERYPNMTSAMVYVARLRERANRRALFRFVRALGEEAA